LFLARRLDRVEDVRDRDDLGELERVDPCELRILEVKSEIALEDLTCVAERSLRLRLVLLTCNRNMNVTIAGIAKLEASVLSAEPCLESRASLLVGGHLPALAHSENADDCDCAFVGFIAVHEPVPRLPLAAGGVELDRAAVGEDLEAADHPHFASEVGVLLECHEQPHDFPPKLG
jgi:hypothetical protein